MAIYGNDDARVDTMTKSATTKSATEALIDRISELGWSSWVTYDVIIK